MNVLFVDHYLLLDIQAMSRARPNYNLKTIPPELFLDWTKGKFPPEMVQYPDEEERLTPEVRKAWENYNEKIFKDIYAIFPFDLLVTPTDDVHYLRRFIRLCRSHGIPTVMQMKEGTCTDTHLKNALMCHHMKNPLIISDLLIASSERNRQFWINSRVAPEKIVSAGQARFDMYFYEDLLQPLENYGVKKTPGKKMLLFLGYHPTGLAMNPEEEKLEKYNTAKVRQETLEVFYSFLRRHPDVELVVKFHPQQHHAGDRNIFLNMLKSQKDLSIQVVEGTEGAAELIQASDAVVGMGSTALVEAMIVNKPAIFALWKETWPNLDERLLPHRKSGACEVADSPQELERLLEQALYHPETLPDRTQAKKDYILYQLGPVDGHCSERSWQAIEKFMAEWKQAQVDSEPPSLLSYLDRMKV